VIAPSAVLQWCSEAHRLGPFWALVVASLLPLGWGLWCWVRYQGMSFFSVFGLLAIVVTGGLGLLNLDAFWFGVKEVSFTVLLALAFPLSHRWGPRPVVKSLVMQPQLINERAIEASILNADMRAAYDGLLLRASWGFAVGLFVSSGVNFALAMWLLGGQTPGSEGYVKAIGTLNWVGTLGIGLPLIGAMLWVLVRFIHGVERLTGLERYDFLGPGQTVRRQVR
jgi:hypothetical protein